MVVDPKNPLHVVVVDTDLLAAKCGWHTTFDGGKTWTDGAFTLPPGFSACRIDAPSGGHVPSGSVAIGAYGTVYATFASANASDDRRESILLVTSIDGGTTWLPAKVAAPAPPGYGLARPLMTLGTGPTGKDGVLLSFWGCHTVQTPTGQATACDEALFSRSADGGNTFSSPVLVNKPPGGQNPSQPAVGPDGTLYLTFQRRYPDMHVDLFLAQSHDAGMTWSESKIDTENQLGLQYDPAKLVVDPRTGALYSVWNDQRTGTFQIFFVKSTNKGATWSQATLITPDPSVNGSSYDPSITIAPDGRIDIAFYYTPPETPNDDIAYLDSSTSGGQYWGIKQVSPKPIDRTLGYSGPIGKQGEVGSDNPPMVASLNNVAYVVWSDTANATPQTQTQDVDMRAFQFTTVAGATVP